MKTLIAQHGSVTRADAEHLQSLGYSVAFAMDVNGIRTLNGFPDMTLRQYYAGQALQGLCSRLGKERFDDLLSGLQGGKNEARVALQLSDALITEESNHE